MQKGKIGKEKTNDLLPVVKEAEYLRGTEKTKACKMFGGGGGGTNTSRGGDAIIRRIALPRAREKKHMLRGTNSLQTVGGGLDKEV